METITRVPRNRNVVFRLRMLVVCENHDFDEVVSSDFTKKMKIYLKMREMREYT